jgi:hypothetical protein
MLGTKKRGLIFLGDRLFSEYSRFWPVLPSSVLHIHPSRRVREVGQAVPGPGGSGSVPNGALLSVGLYHETVLQVDKSDIDTTNSPAN